MADESNLVLLRTRAGRIHKAVMFNGVPLTNESCNLDDAPGGEAVITFADLEAAEESDLCANESCFPRDPEPVA